MVEVEERQQDEAIPWDDVMALFPFGLPTSLQRRFQSSNVVDLEQWRRYRAQVSGTQPRSRSD